MKIPPKLTIGAIRALSHDLSARFRDAAAECKSHPGQLFFPKRTHELSPVDGDAPGGLSPDYLLLADYLNTSVTSASTADVLAVLMHTVEAEIARARIVEVQLLAALGSDE